MIEAIRKVGERILEDFDGNSELDKKKYILKRLSNNANLSYHTKKGDEIIKKPIKKIIINLNIKEKQIEINLDEDLRQEDINFIFSPQSPRGKKIDFNTNNLKYHVENTIPDLIKYVEEDVPTKEEYSDFKNLLIKIEKIFYQNKKLNFKLVKEKKQCKNFEELLLKKLDITKNDFNKYNAFFLYINGKSIQEQDFFEEYIKIKYHQVIGRFFENNKLVKGKKRSHFSERDSEITNEVSFLTKFYMTDKSVFFENNKFSNAYKSFTADKETFEQLNLGTNYVYKNLSFRLSELDYLLIPKSEDFISDLEKNSKRIKKNINELEQKGWEKEKKQLEEISYRQEDKNWKFDLMFYEKDKSSFNVYKIINDLSYFNIKEISETIGKINKDSEEITRYHDYLKSYNYSFNLNSIWKIHYSWVKLTKFKDKKPIYRKEMLDLLEAIFTRRKMKQQKEIKKILYNIKRNYYSKKGEEKQVSPELIFDTINYLNFLSQLNMMKNKEINEKRNLFTEKISNEYLGEYFNKNRSIFEEEIENGIERQGLIMLGYLVNKIIYAQTKKNTKRTKTFMDKINFDGIKKEDVEKKFVTDVIEYLELYKKEIYDEPLLFSEMQERLNNIKESSLEKEEIVYYILLGNFLGKYIGVKEGAQKSEEESEKNKNSKEQFKIEENGN
jgi:CRISPR-associated protein Csh1